MAPSTPTATPAPRARAPWQPPRLARLNTRAATLGPNVQQGDGPWTAS